MSELDAGIAREVITPPRGVGLAGYLNWRANNGVRDDLYVRVTLFRTGETIGGVVSFDVCEIGEEVLTLTRNRLREAGCAFGDQLLYTATHTHTGPVTAPLFGFAHDHRVCQELAAAAARAVLRAAANLQPTELLAVTSRDNPLAFNRRYWMKNGRVVTNPGKGNPNVVRPEGPVDDEITVLVMRQQNRTAALLVNIVNHTDTVGGDLVSADWPGRMERALQGTADGDPQVTTLIGCSGNINHFDLRNPKPQTCYAEACRLGSAYAEIVRAMLPRAEKLAPDEFRIRTAEFDLFNQTIAPEAVTAARTRLEALGMASNSGNMTSEGLAAEDGPVARFFAEQLIGFAERESGSSKTVRLVRLSVGDQFELLGLPGEPFTEIGLELKSAMTGRFRMVASLTNSGAGYITLPECHERGGYEILPVIGGGPAPDTAPRLIEAAKALIR